MGILWPHSNSIIRTNADQRAAGAKIYFFEAGTTTPRTSYQDADLTTPHPHPVIADAYGRAPAIFLAYGDYRERVRTAGGTTLWDTDDIPNPAPVDPETDTDPDAIFQTGDYLFVGRNGTRNGFVRCNGRGIGSATSGASERANPDCEDLFLYLWNNYGQAQCAVSGGRGASAAADWSANKTISLPDHRGATMIGFDDMGSNDSGQTDNAPVETGSGILPGSILGANTHTLSAAQTPTHTHSFSATTGAGGAHTHSFSATTSSDGAHTHTGTTDNGGVDHTHTYNTRNATASFAGGGTPNVFLQDATGTTSGASAYLHTHAFTTASSGAHTHTVGGTTGVESSHTHSVSGTTGSTGGGSAHNNLQRSVPVTALMKL